jgi:hypothetical protein
MLRMDAALEGMSQDRVRQASSVPRLGEREESISSAHGLVNRKLHADDGRPQVATSHVPASSPWPQKTSSEDPVLTGAPRVPPGPGAADCSSSSARVERGVEQGKL